MRITSGYRVEIQKLHKPLARTMKICRDAVDWLYPVIDGEWEALSRIRWEKQRFNAAEKLIHTTKRNRAEYAFDAAFPKMPSYLRRAVLQHVLGAVSSARTRSAGSAEAGASPKEPGICGLISGKGPDGSVLSAETACVKAAVESGEPGEPSCGKGRKTEGIPGRNHYMPVFYKDNMYRKEEDRVFLKLYDGKDWVWQEVRLKKTDLDYIRKNWSGVKAKSPVLVKRHRKYFLQFAFEQEVALTGKCAGMQRICAVDLGINTDAVCSIMEADGTVAARKFISFAAEKDRLWHVLNRVRKEQRMHGPQSVRGFWAYARRLNEELARKTAGAIVGFAKENRADVIVFEHLDTGGKKMRGKNRQKLHMWKKQSVQETAEHQAHRLGMRVSRVCAWKTSAYAYDGSGKVARDPKNHSLAVFPNGKQYNCDLSASYNIGARYFIRELLKPVPETERSALEAKVPAVQRRTSCVYADLRKLSAAMAEREAA